MTAPTVTITNDPDDLLVYQNTEDNRPYFYVTIEVDSVVYDITSYLLEIPLIERKKYVLPESASDLRGTDAIFSCANVDNYFSPLNPSGLFYGKTYFDSKVIIYAGFYSSDTAAIVLPQLVCFLNEVRICTEKNSVELSCSGITKKVSRKKVGEPDTDGTANPKVYSGTQTFKAIAEDLLSTYGELTSSEYSVQDIEVTFTDISFNNISVALALSYICQAASADIYEGRNGSIKITQVDALIKSTLSELTDNKDILGAYISFSDADLIKKISITGESSVYAEETVEANVSGRIIDITNNYVQTEALATDIVSRFVERYGIVPVLIEMDIAYLPTIDVGDIYTVTETQSGILNTEFEVYRLILDVGHVKGKIYLIKSYFSADNFCFFADRGSASNFEGATALLVLYGEGFNGSTNIEDSSAVFNNSGTNKTQYFVQNTTIDSSTYKSPYSSIALAPNAYGGVTYGYYGSSAGNLSTVDWSILFWIKFSNLNDSQLSIILDISEPVSYIKAQIVGSKLRITVYFYNGSVKADITLTSDYEITADTWYHICVVRNGTDCIIFINGVSVDLTTTVAFGTNDLGHFNYAKIEAYSTGTPRPVIHLDEFLFLLNKAVYTSNFTPEGSITNSENYYGIFGDRDVVDDTPPNYVFAR